MVGLVLTRGCICSIDFLVLCHCGGKCRLRISIIEGELCLRRDFNTRGDVFCSMVLLSTDIDGCTGRGPNGGRDQIRAKLLARGLDPERDEDSFNDMS